MCYMPGLLTNTSHERMILYDMLGKSWEVVGGDIFSVKLTHYCVL